MRVSQSISFIWAISIFTCSILIFVPRGFCQPGLLDLDFDPGTGANGEIHSLGMQSDGKLIIGGAFTTFNGTNQNRLARLNSDGNLDPSFSAFGANGVISNVFVLSDDYIIISGGFTGYSGVSRYRVARLNADGNLDTTFTSPLDSTNSPLNSMVPVLAVQRDGRIIFARSNPSSGAQFAIQRLMQNGSFDTSFEEFWIDCAQGGGCNSPSISRGIQGDNKLIVGKDFFLRFHGHGSRDSTFMASNTNKGVFSFAFQNDEKILIAGTFTNFAGVPRNRIARLNEDGTLDLSFDAGSGPNNGTNILAIQPDGKILIAGTFTNFNVATRNRIARLHSDGSLDSTFDAGDGPNGPVKAMLQTSDGKIIVAGQFSSVDGIPRNGIARLSGDAPSIPSFTVQPTNLVVRHGQKASFTCNVFSSPPARYQWRFNNVDIPDATNQVLHFPSVHFTNAGNYEVMATNALGNATSAIAELSVHRADVHAGSLDSGFMTAGTDGFVNSIAVKNDNKIVIGGSFRQIAGAPRNFIAQLNPDGSLDPNFNPGLGFNDKVYAVAVQNDGKILAGGLFTNFNGSARSRVARLNADGTLDATFGTVSMTIGSINPSVNAFDLHSDGKIVIGGDFSSVGGHFSRSVARLRTNGLVDTSFTINLSGEISYSPHINSLVVQPDGKIVVGGKFLTGLHFGSATNFFRLQTNGSLDSVFFAPNLPVQEEVYAIQLQPDGKILVGGITPFQPIPVHPFARRYGFLARLNTNGHADVSFNVVTNAESSVRAIALQTDGKIIVAGEFLNFNNSPRRYIARLHPDGTIDHSIVSPDISDAAALTVAAFSNGKALVGGKFASINNTSRGGVARLNGDIKILDSTLVETGLSVTFLADADKNYTLKYQNVLGGDDWTGLSSLSGSNGFQTLTDPNFTEPQRFYKITAE